MTKRVLIVLSLLAATACGSAPPPMNAPDDLAAVTTLRDAFIKAFNANDPNAIADLYTADGVVMNNHEPTATGHDAIVAANTAMFDQMAAMIEVMPEETHTMGTSGYDRGHYKMTLTPKAGGAPIVDEGRYVVLLEKGADGAWKVSRDIGNSPTPLPMPPAPTMTGKGK